MKKLVISGVWSLFYLLCCGPSIEDCPAFDSQNTLDEKIANIDCLLSIVQEFDKADVSKTIHIFLPPDEGIISDEEIPFTIKTSILETINRLRDRAAQCNFI